MFTAMLVASLFAPAADLNEAAQKELKALEGDWLLVSWVTNGTERELAADEQITVTVTGAKFTFGKFGDGQVTALDPSTSPPIIDFKMLRKPESGVTNEAIFKVEKHVLTVVVYLGEGSKRPANFDAAAEKESQAAKFVLKRVKK
ncbi:TIGR03067 domain-containing protein [Gemmata sp. G18]|uniref:TIGR03067 domain-containing protein n=1 Tax=Gemmata palustris TaxID=2822762 RepID=A0ABS5BLH9_9BACT|nr:TIGR03067 domain-containing protein [Gemmata palustris]MBP3954556.1 TIGR03067 domain-containing protein [Gemmata palustris]